MKLLPIFIFCFFCCSFAFAQKTVSHPLKVEKHRGSVLGNIQDASSGAPILNATISLIPFSDTNFSTRKLSDKNGSFFFDQVPFGFYQLKISALGFASLMVDSIWVRAEKDELVLNDLIVKPTTTSLTEVVVYADKKLIEDKEGVLTYNASESPIGAGSSASDLLKNMPLVSANADGSLSVKGKAPLILIDEKPTNLNAQQLADLLESLPANLIEKVELMQTPPPEYATYDGAVMNIVSKKGRIGLSQRYALSAGSRGAGTASSNILYKSARFSFSSNLSVGASESFGNAWSHRQNFYTDSSNFFYSATDFYNKNWHPNLRIQSDYDFNKRKSLGFVYQSNFNFLDNSSNTVYSNLDSNLIPWKESIRKVHYLGSSFSHGLSSSFIWKGLNPAEKLQVYAGVNFGKNENDKDFFSSEALQNQLIDLFSTSYYLRTNYAKPLTISGKQILTAGFSFTDNHHQNMLNANFFNNSIGDFILNDSLSNHFFFVQSIFTTRLGGVFIFPAGWRVNMGVQSEFTSASFHFVKGNTVNTDNNYWRFLPNLTIRKELSSAFNVSLTLKQTIRRPGMAELNPSVDYTDPFNIRFGNPSIRPALTQNIDFSLGFSGKKWSMNASGGYNKVKDVFSSIRSLVGGRTQTTFLNIADQDEYHASFWSGITITRKFKLNVSAGINYNQYSASDKQLYHYTDGGSYYAGLNYSFVPDNLTMLEASNKFNRVANPQGRSRSNVDMKLSVQRKFLNKKLVVNLAAIDPFGLATFIGYTEGKNFILNSYSASNTRNFRLTISYQLNKNFLEKQLARK